MLQEEFYLSVYCHIGMGILSDVIDDLKDRIDDYLTFEDDLKSDNHDRDIEIMKIEFNKALQIYNHGSSVKKDYQLYTF